MEVDHTYRAYISKTVHTAQLGQTFLQNSQRRLLTTLEDHTHIVKSFEAPVDSTDPNSRPAMCSFFLA